MKGALACYVEAVRALQDAGVRLRGDVLIACVAGEIEKTQWGDDFVGSEYRGYAAGSRYLVTHGGVADMCILGEPTEQKIVLGHFGSLWLRISTSGPFIHTAFSEGRRDENSILRMRDVLDAVLEWLPSGRSERRYGGVRGDRQHRRDQRRLRLARLPDAAPHRPLPRLPRAADDADGGGRGARATSPVASRERFPDTGSSRRSTSPRPAPRSTRITRSSRAIDEAHAGGVRRAAGARHRALVLGRVGADALRDRDASTTARRAACRTPSSARTSTSTGLCGLPRCTLVAASESAGRR